MRKFFQEGGLREAGETYITHRPHPITKVVAVNCFFRNVFSPIETEIICLRIGIIIMVRFKVRVGLLHVIDSWKKLHVLFKKINLSCTNSETSMPYCCLLVPPPPVLDLGLLFLLLLLTLTPC